VNGEGELDHQRRSPQRHADRRRTKDLCSHRRVCLKPPSVRMRLRVYDNRSDRDGQ